MNECGWCQERVGDLHLLVVHEDDPIDKQPSDLFCSRYCVGVQYLEDAFGAMEPIAVLNFANYIEGIVGWHVRKAQWTLEQGPI